MTTWVPYDYAGDHFGRMRVAAIVNDDDGACERCGASGTFRLVCLPTRAALTGPLCGPCKDAVADRYRTINRR